MVTDPALLSATDLIENYRNKSLSPVEVADAALARIEKFNDQLNAFCLLDAEKTRADAKASEQRWAKGEPMGRLDGIPTSIKDLTVTKGWPTMRGSKTTDPSAPMEDDAPYVTRMREHGAVFVGKTTTPEFGWKGITDNLLTGITRNPWNPETTPGGSSGGAAVAAAMGMGALHQGSDGGGSIRIPSGFTGIYGIKGNFGRVPAWPASPFGTVSHAGPMTRTVADAALMLQVMSEPDARDWYALPPEHVDFTTCLNEPVKGWRIAYCRSMGGGAPNDPEIETLVDKAVDDLRGLGAVVEEIEAPFPFCHEVFNVLWYAGAANLVSTMSEEQKHLLDPGLQEIAETGSKYSLLEYLAAVKVREANGAALNAMFADFDMLVTPTLPIPAFTAGIEVPEGSGMKRWTEWTPFSYPFNFTQNPAATIPCGLTSGGLPAGLHMVGDKYREDKVLALSAAYERVHPVELPPMALD